MSDTRPVVLVAEDDEGFRETLTLEFQERGYDVHAAADRAGVEHLLATGVTPRFAVLDLRLGTDDGLGVLDLLLEKNPKVRAVMLTGYGSFSTAVRAVKSGAVNYLAKPISFTRLERALWTDDPDPREVAVPDARESLARHEREYIEYVLLQCDGNISKAARWLGIHRQSLQRKLRKFTP